MLFYAFSGYTVYIKGRPELGREEENMFGLTIALSVYSVVASVVLVTVGALRAYRRRYKIKHRFLED